MRADADTATTGAAASEASVSSSRPPTPRPPASGRVARNRARRSDEFLRAALAIVVDQGFEALTMARLAQEVDTAIGSVYRYYASKDHLLLAVQTSAVEKLTATFAASVPPVVEAVIERLPEEDRHLVELAVSGRWFVATADVLPEEVRLFQMVSARRTSALAPGGGDSLIPTVLGFLAPIVERIDAATAAGTITDGVALGRAVLWLTALGGVLEADDLEHYLPAVLGGGRLARQLSLDLLTGWGADPAGLARVDAAVDAVAATGPLVRAPEG